MIFLKEEILNISDITYLNENLLADLSAVCNYYRAQGNRILFYCKKRCSEDEIESFLDRMDQRENIGILFD